MHICTVRTKCPKNYPAEGRPVFILAQYSLQEEGVEFVDLWNWGDAGLGHLRRQTVDICLALALLRPAEI